MIFCCWLLSPKSGRREYEDESSLRTFVLVDKDLQHMTSREEQRERRGLRDKTCDHAPSMHRKGCLEMLTEKEQMFAAKLHMISLMQQNHSWQDATAAVAIPMCRSSVYRLLRAVQTRGEAALHDGRHGHPAKLRDVVRQWLLATYHAVPQTPSKELQTAVKEHFGILVSIGHLNRVRAELGMSNRVGRQKKNSIFHLLFTRFTGRKVLVRCFLLLPHTKLDCSKQ